MILFVRGLYLPLLQRLEDSARYTGLLLAPAEGFGLRAKKRAYYAVWPVFGNFGVQ